ncbi:MAG: hypothetical protein NT172_16725 [Planctomycetota bacterium]|nr:hypothetical protein [Planctomycetota bacterium]
MEYATQRTRFIEIASGTGLGDPKLTTDARLALRYQITTENRADKLVRRLDGLKRAGKPSWSNRWSPCQPSNRLKPTSKAP